MSLTDATATNLFRNSYLTFIGGQWMKLSPHKIRSTVLPMKICTVERTFPKASMSMAVAEDIDGAELLDVEEEVIDNYIWTPELVIPIFLRALSTALYRLKLNNLSTQHAYRIPSYCLS